MRQWLLLCALFVQILENYCDVNVTVEFETDGFSITQFISNLGYPVEAHVDIETEDGYLLDMHRIPNGKFENGSDSNKPIAFLMHGLLGSAENWIISGPDKGLAFLLADMGYDVWMGNARGTAHSRKHKTLSPDYDGEYWQFSWHEIGVYDLPAKIDYILEETNKTELFYIGHSQGTTSFFVMASERPEYNAKIKLMVALAPVVFMSNLPHLAVQFLSTFERGLSIFSNIIGLNEFVPNNEVLKLAGQALCQERALIQELCANILFLIAGYDSDQLDRSLLPLISQTTPAGAAVRQFAHYGQEIGSGRFQKFSYGLLQNLERYGSTVPPAYDLSKVEAPVVLCYSKNDWLVSIDDVESLSRTLPNVAYNYLVPYDAFNHLDFLFAKDIVPLLYSTVLYIMNSTLQQ